MYLQSEREKSYQTIRVSELRSIIWFYLWFKHILLEKKTVAIIKHVLTL